MVSIIKVQCPHCGIEGQLVLPDIDALVVGPCPECNKSVLIFAGKALPLDTELMTNGNREEVYKHLYTVLRKFIRDRLDLIFNATPPDNANPNQGQVGDPSEPLSPEEADVPPSISEKEMNEFLNKELPLLDNIHYFKTIFGQ